jgi:hypothetical protein
MSHFEAVIFRFTPDAGTGEALNVGLTMVTEGGSFAVSASARDWKRVEHAFPTLRRSLARAMRRLDAHIRWKRGTDRWAAVANLSQLLKDDCIRPSEPIEGETDDIMETFDRLKHRYMPVADAVAAKVGT